MEREDWVRLGAVSAMAGGLAWIVKGGMILSVGVQPPLLFEIAPALFAVGLLAVSRRLTSHGRMKKAGAVLAAFALIAGIVSLVAPADDGEFSPALLVSSIALVAGLMLLGVPARRESLFGPGAASSLPLYLGLGTIPALMVGGGLAAIHERLLEIPVVFLGVLWAYLGVRLWAVAIPELPNEAAGGQAEPAVETR